MRADAGAMVMSALILIHHTPRTREWITPALAWCLVWLMAPEIGVGPFRA